LCERYVHDPESISGAVHPEKDGPMLDFLFGFNSRLGRLHYSLSIIALAVVSVAVDLALSPYSIRQLASGAKPAVSHFAWPLIVPTVGFLLINYALKSMRIRDMGWDPVCVLPAWIALATVDSIIASRVPAWSIGHLHHGTIVGAMIQFALTIALMFWPSGGFEASTPASGGSKRNPQGRSQGSDPTSQSVARMARVTGAGFGRRS
jgi:uncharacterized membrane protein YhaH (DUF805 family)